MAERSADYRVGEAGDLGVSVEDVCAFYRRHWRREVAIGLPSFYQWQFCETPENAGKDVNCVVLDKNDEVAGIVGVNRRTFWLNGKPRKAADLTTWIIAERLQGKGLGRKVLGFLQESYDAILGLGVTPQALVLYMTSGFQYLRYVPRFVRVFDIEAIAEHAQIEKLGERLIHNWKQAERTPYAVHPVEAGKLVDCAHFLEGSFNYFTRDEDLLAWRYDRHPFFAYESFLIESQGGKAAIILRVDHVAGMKVVHVIDCFGSDAALAGAVSFIDDYCLENAASVTDFYCTAPAISRHFRARGWFSMVDDFWFQFIPLFYPPEWRTPPTTSMIYWARDDMIDLMDVARLHVTKGDMDMDRPTIASYRSAGVVDEISKFGYGKPSSSKQKTD